MIKNKDILQHQKHKPFYKVQLSLFYEKQTVAYVSGICLFAA